MARVEGQMWIDSASPNKLKYYVNKMEYEVEGTPSFPLDSDTTKNPKKGQMVCVKGGKLYPSQFPDNITNTVGVMGTTFKVKDDNYANVVRSGILSLNEAELTETFDTLDVPSGVDDTSLIGAPVYWFIGRWNKTSSTYTYTDPSTKIGKLSLYTPSGFQWGVTSVAEPSFNIGYDYLPTIGTVKKVVIKNSKLKSMDIDVNFTGIEESFGWTWPHFHFGDEDKISPDTNNKVEITVRHGLFPETEISEGRHKAKPSCVCQTIITDDEDIEYNANVSIQNYGVSNGDKFDTKLEMITPDTYRYLVHGSISYRLDKGHN